MKGTVLNVHNSLIPSTHVNIDEPWWRPKQYKTPSEHMYYNELKRPDILLRIISLDPQSHMKATKNYHVCSARYIKNYFVSASKASNYANQRKALLGAVRTRSLWAYSRVAIKSGISDDSERIRDYVQSGEIRGKREIFHKIRENQGRVQLFLLLHLRAMTFSILNHISGWVWQSPNFTFLYIILFPCSPYEA